MTAPKYRFCWWCSRQLYSGSHRVVEVDGHEVRLHVACVDEASKNGNYATFEKIKDAEILAREKAKS